MSAAGACQTRPLSCEAWCLIIGDELGRQSAAPRGGLAADHGVDLIIHAQSKQDGLRPLQQRGSTHLRKLFETLGYRQEMTSSKLTHLAGETDAAVSQQDLCLADTTRMENKLSRRRVAGRILVGQIKVEIAQRDPAAFATPPDMEKAGAVGQ